MPIDETKNEDLVPLTASDYGKSATPRDNFLETTVEQLRSTLNSARPSPLQKEIVSWSETEVDQTYDGPENAMF